MGRRGGGRDQVAYLRYARDLTKMQGALGPADLIDLGRGGYEEEVEAEEEDEDEECLAGLCPAIREQLRSIELDQLFLPPLALSNRLALAQASSYVELMASVESQLKAIFLRMMALGGVEGGMNEECRALVAHFDLVFWHQTTYPIEEGGRCSTFSLLDYEPGMEWELSEEARERAIGLGVPLNPRKARKTMAAERALRIDPWGKEEGNKARGGIAWPCQDGTPESGAGSASKVRQQRVLISLVRLSFRQMSFRMNHHNGWKMHLTILSLTR